jgi:hypothetical protein
LKQPSSKTTFIAKVGRICEIVIIHITNWLSRGDGRSLLAFISFIRSLRHRAIPVQCLALGLGLGLGVACREYWYRYQNDLPDKSNLNLKENNDVGLMTKKSPISY